MPAEYKYKAFISYRHNADDMKVAEHLHNGIERYHIPRSIRKSIGFNGNLDIFRDKYDLPVTDSLNDTIATALLESEYLIVICSTHLKESVWVEKEIELFLKTHPKQNILTVLVDGEPNKVIPECLLYEETEEITEDGERIITRTDLEPLSADYREGINKSKKTELPRLVAGLLGCTYEDLLLRQHKYKTRMMASIGFGIVCLALIASTYILWSSRKINENYKKALFHQSEYFSEESVRVKEEEENVELAIQLALSAVPQPDNDMPYNPHAQYALSNALEPYSTPSKNKYTGIQYFEGEKEETLDKITASEDGRYLAATTRQSEKKQYLYMWDTKAKKLIAKHLLDNEFVFKADLFFFKKELWLIMPYSIKVYSLSNGSEKKEIVPEASVKNNKPYISKNYWNNERLYFIFNNELHVYNMNSLKMLTKITSDELDLDTASSFIISPDNRYMALSYYGSANDGKSDKLMVMDLESKKVVFEKSIVGKGFSYIIDMCFWNDNIIISNSDFTGSSDYTKDRGHGIRTYPKSYVKNEVISFNCSTGITNWKVSTREGTQTLDTFGNFFPVQTRNINIFGTDKYIETIVIVDDNRVLFVHPQTGALLQEDTLPNSNLRLSGKSTYEKKDCIVIFSSKDNQLIELYLDEDSLTTTYNYLTFKRRRINYIYGGISDDFLIVGFGDELIQYKKRDINPDCITLDDDFLSCEIIDWFAFKDYLAILFSSNNNIEKDNAYNGIRLYNLKNKKLYDATPIDNVLSNSHFLGVVDQRYILWEETNNFLIRYYNIYKYDIKTKKMEKLNVWGANEDYSYRAIDAQIINNELVLLMEYSNKNSIELNRAVYDLSDGTFNNQSRKIKNIFKSPIRTQVLNNSGTLAYIESDENEHAVVCLDKGELTPLDNDIIGKCDHIQCSNRYVALYDGKKILVFDTEKEIVILEIENPDIASFSLTNDYLFCLGIDSKLSRISLKDGNSKSVLLKKYNKYKNINLKTINDNKMGCWYFDNHSIKITIGYLDEINMFEIDKDSLELVGHNDSIFMFSEDTNSYFAKIENEDSDISRNDFKIGMYPCYSLENLIEKGKSLINNKEMSESKKMRYGLE